MKFSKTRFVHADLFFGVALFSVCGGGATVVAPTCTIGCTVSGLSGTGMANTGSAAGAADGTGTAAKFSAPSVITSDGTNLYVVDGYCIRKIQ